MQKNIKIDLITHDPSKDACKLIAVAQGPWPVHEIESQMRILQEKLSSYVDAAVDGIIAKEYPKFSGKSLVIRLDCYGVPREEVEQFFNRYSEHIRNSTEIQASIAQHHHIKDLSFEFSWASISEALKDSEHKDISDPTYSAADFWLQLTGGRLRWLASVVAVASAGLFVYLLTQGDKAEIDYPFVITGQAAFWTVGIVFVVLATMAVVNWKNYFRRKKDAT